MSKCKFDGIGRLAADAETKQRPDGTRILSWRMACDRGYGDKKETEWVSCAIFGKRAEGSLGKYLTKGTLVAVRGDVKINTYTDKQGEYRASASVYVDELILLGSNQSNQQQSSNSYAQASGGNTQSDGFADDEIPF